MDEAEVLEAKVELVVEFLKQAKCCVVYTGAGLSRAAGIADYASIAKNSVANQAPKLRNPFEAKPTFSHRAIVELERAGLIAHYVQQNHDGLPQKAGFPQEKINEIHGAWYDPSNPVVAMNGSLRSDLYNSMNKIKYQTDFCLCLGTSLSGMSADDVAEKPAKMSLDDPSVLGTVIINLQQTRLNDYSAIRIWAKLDDVFASILKKLNLNLNKRDPKISAALKDQFIVPYDSNGNLDLSRRMIWDLRVGSEHVVRIPDSSTFNQSGSVYEKDQEGNYVMYFGSKPRVLGRWWVESAMQGKVQVLRSE